MKIKLLFAGLPGKLRLCGGAVFAAIVAAAGPAAADVVLFDGSSSGADAVSPQDGARLSFGNGAMRVEAGAPTRNPGFKLSGSWDLSGCDRVEVEIENGGKEEYLLRLRNKGGAPGVPGCKVYALKTKGEERETLCADWLFHTTPTNLDAIAAHIKPVRTWAFPYASGLPWEAFVTRRVKPDAPGSLDLRDVREVSMYLRKPARACSWSVRRIVAKDARPLASREAQEWTALTEKEFFPFIDRYGQFIHKEWPDKVHSDADFAVQREKEAKDLAVHPGPGGWDKWGGWKDGPQFEKTGGFYTRKVNGKWWIVDPDGHLWWSHGPVRVTPSSGITPLATPAGDRRHWFAELPARDEPLLGAFYETRDELLWPHHLKRGIDQVYDFSAANIRRKYGENWFEIWADLAHRRLRSWSCNTMANSSDSRICLMDRTPYTERYEIHSRVIEGHTGGWWAFCDPFDPSFREEAKRMTEVYRAEFEDPWCIGFFVDNEHNWGMPCTMAMAVLKSSADQTAKGVFRERLMSKYGEIGKLNERWGTSYAGWDAFMADKAGPDASGGAQEDLEAFSAEIADNYYRIIREEMKRANPRKLYLGCRWAGRPPAFTVKAAAKYCDVLSYNIYSKDVRSFMLPDGIDAPVLIGEFHFGALDRGPFCPGLILLRDQCLRADTYKNYVRSAVEHPQIVGAHWHQLSDQPTSGRFDGENMQVGWTDICDTPYWETVAAVREIGAAMYGLRYGSETK